MLIDFTVCGDFTYLRCDVCGETVLDTKDERNVGLNELVSASHQHASECKGEPE